MTTYPKKQNLLWIVILLLGWFFDYLFWEKEVGINFAIFTTASLLGGFFLLLADGYRPHPKSLWLLIPFFFFTVMTFLRREQLTVFLSYTFASFSLGVMASTYQGGRWIEYVLPDYLYKFLVLVIGVLQRPAELFFYNKKSKGEQAKSSLVWSILRGLVLATPVVLCFGSLLASADLVFDKLYFDALGDLEDGFYQAIRVLLYSVLLAGIFLYIFMKSKDEKLTGDGEPALKPFLGFTESAIVIGSVSVLFLAFVIIQFQYFFGGQSNIGVEGYTYSEYARRGFSELNLVAFFSILLIIGLNILTRHDEDRQRRIYSVLSILMVALVMVILASSYQRLGLAIDWHGYSRLRLYPRTFLIWIGILLLAVVALQATQKERYFTFAFVFASIGFAVSLSFVNVDQAIIEHNIPRYLQGKNLNVEHLSSLSTDAVPAIVEEFENLTYPLDLHEGIGAILLCYIHSGTIKYDDYLSGDDWRSFNLSSWQAHMALKEIEPQLAEYQILKKLYPKVVRTPGDIRYECGTGSGDF